MLAPVLIASVLLGAVSGCRGPVDGADDIVTAVPEQPTPPAPGARPASLPTAGAPARALRLWSVPPFVQPAEEGAETAGLTVLIDAYGEAGADRAVEVQMLPADGEAGVTAFLASSARLAPSSLPDVAMLPLAAVPDAAAQGWLQPLPVGALSERTEDAFPFARDLATSATGEVWALPFAVNVNHAIARDTPPAAEWSAIEDSSPMVLPGADDGPGSLAVMLGLYGGAGGATGALPDVDGPALDATMEFLAEGIAGGNLTTPASAGSPRASWNTFLLETAPAAIVSGGVFAPQQASFPSLQWSALPGADGPAPPIGWGWAFVILAGDPARAARAADLIGWLTAPEQRGWLAATDTLPAQRTDWDEAVAGQSEIDAPPTPEYLEFLARQLELAEGVSGPSGWDEPWLRALDSVAGGGSADAARAEIDSR